MDRPLFSITTTVLTILCVLAFAAAWLAPHISPLPINRMGKERDEFMREARREMVDWRPMTSETIADARQQARPILLVIGTPTSPVAQHLDHDVFMDPEVAAYLQRNFICARIDGEARPEWLNAFWPVSRLTSPFQPDLQAWALDSAGRAFRFFGRVRGDEDFSASAMIVQLIQIRREFETAQVGNTLEPGTTQIADIKSIAKSPDTKPDFGEYLNLLRRTALRSTGTDPPVGLATLSPQVIRCFSITGEDGSYDALVQSILRSSFCDLLDGGFFHTSLINEGRTVEFEKRPSENAEAMCYLAQADVLHPDRLTRQAAYRTWRYLETYARSANGFVAGQFGETSFKSRSERYSVSMSRLRDSIEPVLQVWAVENLGLDVSKYPQAVPFLEGNVAFNPKKDRVLAELKSSPLKAPITAEAGLADENLTCVARALEACRLWGDPVKVKVALHWLHQLEDLRVGDDIQRRLEDGAAGLGYLGDYLAYADARLQAFLLTGNLSSFRQGLGVLHRAFKVFPSPRPGVFSLNRPDQPAPVPNVVVPEIADNLHESCSARVIRLSFAYGRLLAELRKALVLWKSRNAARPRWPRSRWRAGRPPLGSSMRRRSWRTLGIT